MNVFDASALLAFLQGEDGAEVVERELLAGGVCGAGNWCETAQRVLACDRDWELAKALLASYDLTVEPVLKEDAEEAARRRSGGEGLSLGDRLCLALGNRLDAKVWTADKRWRSAGRVHQIR